MSETKLNITSELDKFQQERICEYVADYLEDNGIEWDSCSFTLIAEYTPDVERQEWRDNGGKDE